MKPVVDGLERTHGDRVDFVMHANLDQDGTASDLARARGVTAVPTSMLVAPDGTELKRWVGVVSEAELRNAFEEALPR